MKIIIKKAKVVAHFAIDNMKNITIIILCLLMASCNNHAFKVVATTVNPTPKQKGLLAIACNNQFKQSPQFIKGELRIDTLTINSSDTVTINKFDTVRVTITNTVKAIVTQFRTDTIKEGNPYKESLLESQLRDKENVISNLENEKAQIKHKLSVARRNGAIVLGLWILTLVAIFVRIYLKLKSKIIGL